MSYVTVIAVSLVISVSNSCAHQTEYNCTQLIFYLSHADTVPTSKDCKPAAFPRVQLFIEVYRICHLTLVRPYHFDLMNDGFRSLESVSYPESWGITLHRLPLVTRR